jgi:hypothetical protein
MGVSTAATIQRQAAALYSVFVSSLLILVIGSGVRLDAQSLGALAAHDAFLPAPIVAFPLGFPATRVAAGLTGDAYTRVLDTRGYVTANVRTFRATRDTIDAFVSYLARGCDACADWGMLSARLRWHPRGAVPLLMVLTVGRSPRQINRSSSSISLLSPATVATGPIRFSAAAGVVAAGISDPHERSVAVRPAGILSAAWLAGRFAFSVATHGVWLEHTYPAATFTIGTRFP